MAHGEEVRLNFDEYVTEKSRIGIVLKDGTKSDLNACASSSNTLIDLQISDGGQGVLKNCRFSDSTEESLILRGSYRETG